MSKLLGDEELPDGGDSPAFSRKREPHSPPPLRRGASAVPYAELHCHSNYSFLDGASHPEELAQRAVELGLAALAITDHDGMYGVARFAEAAELVDLPTVFGAELSLGVTGPQNGKPEPDGPHLLVLARGAEGYHRLSAAVSVAQQRGGTKGVPRYDVEELGSVHNEQWLVLTGCRKGAVRQALATAGVEAARRELDTLVALFGAENVAVELIKHGRPHDDEHNDALAELATRFGLPVVATNNVHYANPERYRLFTALAAVRARRSLDAIDGWLPGDYAYLRSGDEMAAMFARHPGAVANAARLGKECAFSLKLVAPGLPHPGVPSGHTPASQLRHLTMEGARRRYGPPEANPRAYAQLEHELAVIEQLDFPGYFLIVRHIVEFCDDNGILCQGRGSAANSAVCYALGITKVDAVRYGLLFERFLSPERDGYPDIDLDIESDRREKVIQFVYRHYGRQYAAQVANVITYRPRSAVRDMAKALGYSTGQQDAWSKQLDRYHSLEEAPDHDIPPDVVDLARQLLGFPRHLGIHSGGMVLCDRPLGEVCPVEWATMPGRTVLQWDKDDCAWAGLVKFDLLGLGMLSALRYAIEMIREHYGVEVDLANLPQEDAVYDMLCAGDSVGVFQVESRAQISTLPRLQPREFYDLVVEVALIRPGPIQGGSVHPYLDRRKKLRHNPAYKPTALHPLLEKSLAKTLGVPLFQEQLMQMAIDVANFSAADSDQLRRAMGSKRSDERMERLRAKLFAGMAANGITGELAETIYRKLAAFANFGFPESHAISFAHVVYSSSWIKFHYPAAFYAALLNAQPMGFYSPQSLMADARRHDVVVLGPDLNVSVAGADVEQHTGGKAVRLGLSSVRTVSTELADRIVAERRRGGPYRDMADLAQRVSLGTPQLEALATAGVFDGLGVTRREALWAAGAIALLRPDRLPVPVGVQAPVLPLLNAPETAMADVWATGISPDSYPTQFVREALDARGVFTIAALGQARDKQRVRVAGAVTHRQRPATAGGVTFLNLEDETGMLNVVCSPGLWTRYRRVARSARAMIVHGRLERAEGVTSLVAERLEPLALHVALASRDFR